jgi:hypothetical protein
MSLVRLSFELGMAVSDYNCGITNDHLTIIKTTFMYLNKVKESSLTEEELVECYSIIGQMWASVIERPEELKANPLESTEETKPLEPAKAIKPLEPAKVTKPVEPAKPTKPLEPVKVTKPVEPAKPTKPLEPVKTVEVEAIKASLSTIVSSLTKKPESAKVT